MHFKDDAWLEARTAACLRLLREDGPGGELPPALVIAGDVVDRRGAQPARVLEAVAAVLQEAAALFRDVFVLVGNHDQPLRRGAESHSLSVFKGYRRNLRVVDSPFFEGEVRRFGLALMPWRYERAEFLAGVAELAERSATCGSALLFAHVALRGGKTSNGFSPDAPVGVEDLRRDAWAAVFAGDYHRRQEVAPGVHYIGSAWETNFGEANDPPKGALDIRVTDAGAVEVVHVPSNAPRHFEIRAESEADLDAADLLAAENIVRVILPSRAPKLEKGALARELGFVREPEPPLRSAPRYACDPATAAPREVFRAWLGDAERPPLAVEEDDLADLCEEIFDACPNAAGGRASAMALVSVEAQNFLSYGTLAPTPLAGLGAVLVEGANEDEPTAASNGAGKSALVEAVHYALFGRLLRGARAAEVKRRGAPRGEGWFVRLALRVPEGDLVVRRGSSGFGFTLNGERCEPGKPAEAQRRLEELTGWSQRAFALAVVFGQGAASFAAATDAERKAFLEELAGEARFGPCLARAKALRDTAAARLEDLRRELSAAERAIVERQRWVEEFASKLATAPPLEETRQAIAEAEARGAEASAAMKEIPEEIRADLRAAFRAETETAAERDRAQERVESHRRTQDELARAWRLAQRDGQVCGTCGNALAPRQAAEIEEKRGLAVQEETRRLAEAETRQARADAAAQDAAKKAEHARRALALSAEIDKAAREALALRPELERAEALARAQAALAEAEDERDAREDGAAFEEGALAVAEEAVRLFGSGGLKTFLFDALGPRLSDEANTALEALSGGSLRVSLAAKASGKGSREKLALAVENAQGGASYEALSGGEKRKVDLALLWALHRAVAGRCNVLFADEAFDHLDSEAGSRVPELLRGVLAEDGASVFVCTHREEFKEFFPQVWTARKRGGVSCLLGASAPKESESCLA